MFGVGWFELATRLLLAVFALSFRVDAESIVLPSPTVVWQSLPALPHPTGFAGMYAGVIGESALLLAAGGANFPEAPPWAGGKKAWTDAVYALDSPEGQWRTVGKLPRPMGYGVSVSWGGGVLIVGGSDADRAYADVYLLRLDAQGNLTTETWPSLPSPCTQMCGALVGTMVYVAGGINDPNATEAMKTFWAMDLSVAPADRKWETLKPWPGPGRMQAVAGVYNDRFYLFGGIELTKGPDGKPVRVEPFLRDAYRYETWDGSWSTLGGLPRGVAAAPSPAMDIDNGLLIAGGIDAPYPGPQSEHPGFEGPLLRYDARSELTSEIYHSPASVPVVTAPAVEWYGSYVVVSGERAPGVRTPEVASADFYDAPPMAMHDAVPYDSSRDNLKAMFVILGFIAVGAALLSWRLWRLRVPA